jgi:opacity protein-like surface antigen
MKRVALTAAALAVCILATVGSANADGLSFRGIGGNISVVNPEDFDATVGVGFLVDLGAVNTVWGFESFAGYWSQSESAFGTEVSVSDFVLGGRCKYLFPVSHRSIQPYAGAGLGFHFVSASVEIASYDFGGIIVTGSSFDDDEFKVGLDVGGGLTVDINDDLAFLGDSWLSFVSDVSQFSLRLGLLYWLR